MRRYRLAAAAAALFMALAPSSASATPVPVIGSSVVRTDDTAQAQFLRLSIDAVAPGTVTTTSDPFVTVQATVTNVGDRRVDDVNVRLQGAPAVTQSSDLRTSLTADQDNYPNVGDFVVVSPSLDRGASAQFTLSMPLRGSTTPSLGITAPGVYPLLINVNGTPEYGGRARLDDARFLLPVTGLPRDPSAADPASPEAQPLAPSTAAPVAATVLWPLADKPRLAAGNPGSTGDKVRLIDDDLAAELSSGGRLDSLLRAVEFATTPTLDPDSKLSRSICLAIDPDLLVTVSNMTRGYLVADHPSDPFSPTHDGKGQEAATEWLARLVKMASGMCVTALPFAQTDLSAVAQVDNANLLNNAVQTPSAVIDTLLGVTSRRDTVWSSSGMLDATTAGQLQALGSKTALLADTAVIGSSQPDGTPVANMVRINPDTTNPLNVALFDSVTATALAAVGPDPVTPAFTPESQRYQVTSDSRAARLQDAVGTLNWLALSPVTPGQGRNLMIAPPQYWTAADTEPSEILSAISSLFRSGLATPAPLADVLSSEPSTAPVTLAQAPASSSGGGLPQSITSQVQAQGSRVDTLLQSLIDDAKSTTTPRSFTAPLREDLLRSMSLAGRTSSTDSSNGSGDGDGDTAADDAANTRITAVRTGLDRIYGSVTVLAPGGVYTLASGESPLLLVARNDLPLGISVRLSVDAPAQMKVSDIGPTTLPPRGSRTLTVPAQINATQNLAVDFGLTTLDGQQLGQPTKVSIRSNAYGSALAIITAGAGALLLLLAGRRLWHRFRGQPDPADEGYTRP